MSPVEGEPVKARVPKVAEGKSANGKAANLPPPRLCVCGAGNAGAAIAADCALGGLEVALFELPRFRAGLQTILDRGGITLTPDSDPVWGKTGFARLARITTDPAEALADAQVVMITVPAMYHSAFWDILATHLADGQIVLFNTGYHGCLRHARKLEQVEARVTLAESNIMPYLCSKTGDTVHIDRHKRHFRVAAFPGNRSAEVYKVLRLIYPQYEKVDHVLDSNIASGGNPAFHVTLTIPIAGFYFDRYRGGKFYSDTTVQGGRLIEAYDRERETLCRQLGSLAFQSTLEFDRRSYEYDGKDIVSLLRRSEHIDWFASAAYLKQVCEEDILFAYIPMVLLAEQLGLRMPVTRSMVEIFAAMLGESYWERGVTPTQLGIDGMDTSQLLTYITEGSR
ncbi:MAG: NAD/NADP octopine/nopaline dehydrogenase family protein [Spirochaetaceae bacterium]|nr:MAG: NAD/NADP octopine/nopaline dehydrogenase family protein [Spirochaetaceae bacterium]